MALNHLNLTVTDVLATKAFLEKYFDFQAVMEGNDKMTFISDGSMMLSMFKSTDVTYPKDFHIGKRIISDFLRPNLSLIQPPEGQEIISVAAKQAPNIPAIATGIENVLLKNKGNIDTTANSLPKVTA